MSRGYPNTGRRWSKIKKRIEDLFAEGLNLQIYSTFYTTTSKHDSYNSPRHWFVLDKEVIFDFPGQFFNKGPDETRIEYLDGENYKISCLIQEYIELPKEQLLSTHLEMDKWGVIDILRAADRRIGKDRLLERFKDVSSDSAVKKILRKRFENSIS